MNGISIKPQAEKDSRAEQKKLDILTSDFKKLEENRKDYILDLTRKLVDVHCNREMWGKTEDISGIRANFRD